MTASNRSAPPPVTTTAARRWQVLALTIAAMLGSDYSAMTATPATVLVAFIKPVPAGEITPDPPPEVPAPTVKPLEPPVAAPPPRPQPPLSPPRQPQAPVPPPQAPPAPPPEPPQPSPRPPGGHVQLAP